MVYVARDNEYTFFLCKSFPHIKHGETISQDWCEDTRLFSSDSLGQRGSLACGTLDALVHSTGVWVSPATKRR